MRLPAFGILLLVALHLQTGQAGSDSTTASWTRSYGDVAAAFPDSFRSIVQGYHAGVLSSQEAGQALERLRHPTAGSGKT